MAKIEGQVLLIGLGGTGSRIVNNVVSDLQKAARRKNKKFSTADGKMAFAVLDTNMNDVGEINKSLTGINNISTSSEKKIKEYMSQYSYMGVSDWMPRSKTLDEETMIDGASQMRFKSRLALLDTIESHKIDELKNAIQTMIENRELGQKVRVMIVSSLAGGTGSGMFIQTAIWIRKYLDEHSFESTIRGILVLPDVFISTVEDIKKSATEKESLYANAYGAIRELNTITKIKTKNFKPLVPIKIDDIFDSENPELDGKPVFDFAFLIDDVTENGNTMQTIGEYERFISKMVYMQLYAPMKTNLYSEEDNFFRIFERCDEPVFGSCGTSRAVYPMESVLNYCAQRASQEAVSSGWLKIDKKIERMKQEQAKREKEGYNPEKINVKAEYISIFDDETSKQGTQVGSNRLFVSIKNDVKERIVREMNGKPVTEYKDKTLYFIEMMDKYIKETVQSDYKSGLSGVNVSSRLEDITEVSEAEELVQSTEMAVSALVKKFDDDIPKKAGLLLSRIFTDDMGDVNARNELSVFGFLTCRDENDSSKFVHPLAARYLLYKLLIELNKKKTQIIMKSARADAIKGYNGEENPVNFDYKGTRRIFEETPLDYIRAKKSFFESEQKFVSDFLKKYAEYNSNQYNLCEKYGVQLLKFNLYCMLTERLEVLIREIEGFFKNLNKVTNTLEQEINKNIAGTSKVTDRTIYVYASHENKERVYQDIKGECDENNREINDIVLRNLYGRFCAELNEDSKDNAPYVNKSVVDSFAVNVVRTYREDLLKHNRTAIDLDLYTALTMQVDAEMEEENKQQKKSESDVLDVDLEEDKILSENTKQAVYDSEMKKLCDRLRSLAAPCLRSSSEQYDNPNENLIDNTPVDYDEPGFNSKLPVKKHKAFWGFNPIIAGKYPALANTLGVNIAQQQNDAYDINELNCYRAVYGVMAKYIPKLNETPKADYFRNYDNVVKRMTGKVMKGEDDALVDTPHIDKTWHYSMPYVTAERQMKEEKKFYKSFWMALAYNHISLNAKGEFQISVRKTKSTGGEYNDTELIMYNGRPIDLKHIGNLLKALRLDPKFILETHRTLENYLEMDIRLDREDYDKLALISGFERKNYSDNSKYREGGLGSAGFTNAVSMIAKYDSQPVKDNAVTATLADSLVDLIRDVISDDFAEDEKNELERETYKICMKIFNASADERKESIKLFQEWAEKAEE